MARRPGVDAGLQDREPTPVHLGKGARKRRRDGAHQIVHGARALRASRCGRPRAGAGRNKSPARDRAAARRARAGDQPRQAAREHLLRRSATFSDTSSAVSFSRIGTGC